MNCSMRTVWMQIDFKFGEKTENWFSNISDYSISLRNFWAFKTKYVQII